MTDQRRASALLLLGLLAAVFAVFVALTGGIDTRIAGVAVRSRSWERPATVAVVLLAAWLFFVRRRLAGVPARVFKALPLLIVLWGGIAALVFGTYAAGGADSFGYISQAELIAHGHLTEPMPTHPAFNWPDVPATLTPLAFTRGPHPDVLVPVYPPGLPLLMAPLTWIHPSAVFLAVPLCAVLTLWCCLRLGTELEDTQAGTLGALLLSVSPTFLLQSMQPMSDVPVTAAWLGALLLARRPSLKGSALAGLAASLAIMIRPNLAPLALFVVVTCATAVGDGSRERTLRHLVVCAASILPGLVALGYIQDARYGSPLGSGYGSFHDLFAFSNVGPNLSRYPRWLTLAHSPFLWLWLLAPLWFRRGSPRARALGWIGYVFAATVIVAYLPYVYFRPEEWSYTRFLLPALPLMLIFVAGVVLTAARRWLPSLPLGASALVILGIAAWSLQTASSLSVFRSWEGERKYPQVGRFVRDQLPASAFVLAAQHSGSVRYYSHRPTFRWDLLDGASLDRALTSLRVAGYEPFLVVDTGEDEEFRQRFSKSGQRGVAALAPLATIGNTTVYAFK
jgi:4-amino-4-deoxy-L-arabinose transferase-like glycosyltransferase